MLAEEATGVHQREDADQSALSGDERAADVPRVELLQHLVEGDREIDDVGVMHGNVTNEQLFLRQPQIGIERALEIAIREDADQPVAVLTGR